MSTDGRRVPGDWYPGEIPENVVVGPDAYVESSYGFAAFAAERPRALTLGEASGVYDRATLVIGADGVVTVGAYTVLNATNIVCNDRVTIGDHCLLSWGVVITDSWHAAAVDRRARRQALEAAAADPRRRLPPLRPPQPVVIEDSVWIGFDAVVLPGVRLGQGCIVGCKTVVDQDVPPYAVVVGDPARIVRTLAPDDTPAARADALRALRRAPS